MGFMSFHEEERVMRPARCPGSMEWMERKKVEIKVSLVVDAYRERVPGGKGRYARVTLGEKNVEHCLRFLELVQRTGKSLTFLMNLVFELFSPSWCQDAFGTPYPPFNVVVSRRTRSKVVRNLPKEEKETLAQVRSRAGVVGDQLVRSLGMDGALEAVEGGWPSEKRLRKQVEKYLHARINRTSSS